MASEPQARSWWLGLVLVALSGVLAPGGDPVQSPGGEPGRVHALIGATVVTQPGVRIPAGVIVIRDGLIAAVGSSVQVPRDAQVWDMSGRTIYAGLIEPYLRLAPRPSPAKPGEHAPKAKAPAPPAGATHKNSKVRAQSDVVERLSLSPEALKKLRKVGFTAALVSPETGIFRGTSALVALRDGSPREQVIEARVAHHLAFEYGGWGSNSYPNSLMGAMALTRQTLLDSEHDTAAWDYYRRTPLGTPRPKTNESLRALRSALSGELPVCLEARDTGMLLRGARLLKEFDLVPWVVLGQPDAHLWLDEVRRSRVELILSLNFAPLPTWETESELPDVSQRALRAWHDQPATPALLEREGLRFAFTTQGLKDRSTLHARVREAIERGLSPDAALAAFTTVPRRLLNAPQLGVIQPGAAANLTISAGALFAKDSVVTEVWIDGLRYPTQTTPPAPKDFAGQWLLTGPGPALELQLKLKGDVLEGKFRSAEGATWRKLKSLELWRDRLSLRLPESRRSFTLRGHPPVLQGVLDGGPLLLQRTGKVADPEPSEPDVEAEPAPALVLPQRSPWPPLPGPRVKSLLIRDATIWTSGPQGILRGASLLVEDGRISAVGYRVQAPRLAKVIDGRGLHVTPGIIDCHSHSFGVGPVNEATHNATAEVRCADVINPETVQIYRQLAGGVTSAMQLHGSANSIGGQSAVVTLRWGESAEGLLFKGAPAGIKFALGENPKRSNWGEGLKPRYPTSRMGVNESIRERLLAARAYRGRLERWQRDAALGILKLPPRIDLQLDALSEVLSGKRKIHCHSYRQDEILALIRLAEELGFTIGTFQHVLEGYKVAKQIAAHGAGASTFSDWWAYKFEVYDAIPHNAALMHERGVLVSLKSDSSEMARRLNQEAAKAVRYGGVSRADALAMVTRNPARQLGIADKVGSLEVGKQADFVIWSGDPLLTTTRCEQTWIEGRPYWLKTRDSAARAALVKERVALIKAARAARRAPGARGPTDWQATFPKATRTQRAHTHGCCVGGAK
ncbi:MAG: amidohydrolase family protein [Planctomycetes bacterium]|nr:amidohydrolase family protein [Planctomycetota bacterium]